MKRYFKTLIIFLFIILAYLSVPVNCEESEEHKRNLLYLDELKTVRESTVLLNNRGVLPLGNTAKVKIACLNLDCEYADAFVSMAGRYAPVSLIRISEAAFQAKRTGRLRKILKKYNTIIILTSGAPLDNPAIKQFMDSYDKKKQFIVCITGDFGILQKIGTFRQPVIISGINSETSAGYIAQAVFGGVAVSSKLARDYSTAYKKGTGDTTNVIRLHYSVPEEAGINSADLSPIDGIVQDAIARHATPGAVVMVVKDGKVIMERAWGCHTYKGDHPDRVDDIFDLASVTKVSATTLAVMRLYEKGKIQLDRGISSYIPETRKTDKKNITVLDLMLHQSGMPASIPFGNRITKNDYRYKYSKSYNIRVADNFYLRKNYYRKRMWPVVLNCQLGKRGKYVYSDPGMILVKEIVERRSGQAFDRYIYTNFYIPLGMQTSCFNPRERFSKERLVPTEIDNYFRKTTIQGYVHDQTAALMGGVAGHAGAFSCANDLAILFQMLLNRGTYGGTEYFRPETVDFFTTRYSGNSRRGVGFDGRDPGRDPDYPSFLSSDRIYGHTGFTGTCVWADPEQGLIYIFLSNRTYPGTPNKLAEMNVRSRILDVIYTAIEKGHSTTSLF